MSHVAETSWSFNAIGIIHSPCKEKFAVPRQSGLAPDLVSKIEILKPYDRDEAFLALESFSHIWVLSVFHLAQRDDWQPTVRPPRLGGNERVGVFASRSPFRPNPIALSVFKLEGLERVNGILYIKVSGTDLVDGTPVIDIKPYIPYADQPEASLGGYTGTVAKPTLEIEFSPAARQQCQQIEAQTDIKLEKLIIQLISLDPRPAYHRNEEQRYYGLNLYDYNIKFEVVDGVAKIISIDFE